MRKARVSRDVGGLKLRESPHIAARVIDEAAPGDELEIIGTDQGSWVHVRYKGQEGWMYRKHVRQASPFVPTVRPSMLVHVPLAGIVAAVLAAAAAVVSCSMH